MWEERPQGFCKQSELSMNASTAVADQTSGAKQTNGSASAMVWMSLHPSPQAHALKAWWSAVVLLEGGGTFKSGELVGRSEVTGRENGDPGPVLSLFLPSSAMG
jgi:hypothetical protein